MKIRLNDLLIVLYFLLLSLVLKNFLYIPLSIAVLLIIFGDKLDAGIKNLIYVGLAMLPFIPFFIFFIFYLPFIVFGTVMENASFTKKYLLGFAVAHIVRLISHHSHDSVLRLPLSAYSIIIVVSIFLAIAYSIFIKKRGIEALKKLYSIKSEEYKILIITLFFMFFVSHVIFNNTSLYQSNATQIYATQAYVIDMIDKYSLFPQYNPRTGIGEQFFLTDSRMHFTKDILVISTIFLKQWFGPVLVYNTYHMFVLWMIILGASVLIKEVFSLNGEINNKYSLYFVILGSLAIGLSFQFVRTMESFKSFSAHPINLLLLAIILSKPRKFSEFVIIGYLLLITYMIHVLQAIGMLILVVSLVFVLYFRDNQSIGAGFNYFMRNKLKLIIVLLIFVGVTFGYTIIGASFSDYMREYPGGLFQKNILRNIYNYVIDYFTNEGVTPFSFSYGDLGRLDKKESGFFLTFFGGISFIYLLFNFRSEKLRKARIFAIAFIILFLLYDVIINTFNMGTYEMGYRIIHPYTVVVLAVSISAVFTSFKHEITKAVLLIVFFAFLMHSLYFARINLDNIHSEQVISEGTLKSEMDFVRGLPLDGRFLTYGLFANAVDAGMAYKTERYFSRYQYNIWTEVNNIHEKIHTQHSFGEFPGLYNLSGTEFSNYFKLAGYKYLLLNICHPVGNHVLFKVYPNFTTPLYQNQCLVILMVNGTQYAEKVSMLKDVDEEIYKTDVGYKYFTISRLERYGVDVEKTLENALSNDPIELIGLNFERINPQLVNIRGDFEDNEWVAFKEEYFPRWKAYINNVEVPMYPSNFNMILINTIKGNLITLKYDILEYERILNSVSLVAVLLCSFIFIWLLKID